MFPAPPFPPFPEGQSTTAPLPLRFEDVTQDGRMMLLAIPPLLGPLWRDVVISHPAARASIAAGVIPILTRLTLVSHEQRVRADRPAEVHAGFVIAHDGDRDEDRRIYFNAWGELRAPSGKMSWRGGPGELALAGSLFAEHTYTRPMAPPDRRRVTRLDGVPGMPPIPEARYAAPPPKTAQDAPEGARWLEEAEAPDPAEYGFTLDQTDSNQHVNSLAYIRIFLEAVNRRLAATGRALNVRSRAVDIAYRKPCFAGDRVRAELRLFEHPEGLGAAGMIAGGDGKPRCYVRALLGA